MLKAVSKYRVRTIVFLICIVLFALYLFLSKTEREEALTEDEVVHVHCPIHQKNCLIHLAGGAKLELSLSPEGLPALKPLTLKLNAHDIDFDAFTYFDASFSGRDMEMGHHSLVVNSSVTKNELTATGIIPLCPMDPNMVWVLSVKYQYKNKVTVLMFEVPSGTH